jgi:hypothetical protein
VPISRGPNGSGAVLRKWRRWKERRNLNRGKYFAYIPGLADPGWNAPTGRERGVDIAGAVREKYSKILGTGDTLCKSCLMQRRGLTEAQHIKGREFCSMVLDGDKNSLLKEIEDLENEIEEIKKRIPPHSVRYEIIQLLEEKERELERKKDLLQSMRE